MKRLILASASMLAITASPGQAQTAPTAQAGPVPQTIPAANDPGGAAPSSVIDEQAGLADIIVTAQRTAESAQKAAVAISVVRPEELVRQNVTRAEDLSRIVPALVTTASGGPNTSFFIRGVGNTTANSYSDPAISFNYDGVTIGRPNATQGLFFDLQRVEVLKGPQGTLYGRNATGGAVNVIPNRPVIGETSGAVQASYGNYNAFQGQADINLPIGEHGAFRLSGALSKHDGYLSDGTDDQDSKSVRAQVLAELTPSLTTRVAADYSHQGGEGTGSFIYGTYAYAAATGFVFTPTPQFGTTIGVQDPATNAFVQTRFITQVGRFSEPNTILPSQNNAIWGVTNETNWKTDAGTLTVQGGYRNSDIRSLSTTSNFRAFLIDENSHQTTLEARWAGKIGTLVDYLAGGYFYDERISTQAVINQVVSSPFQRYKTGTNSKAAFGRLSVHPVESVTLTAGGRYTVDHKRMDGLSDSLSLNCGNGRPPNSCPTFPLAPLVTTAAQFVAYYQSLGIPVGNNGVQPPAIANQPRILDVQIPINYGLDTNKFTYRLAADWQVAAANLLYASFETGFHGGGFNFGKGLETYQPETIKAYTIGSKNRFFNNRIQLNIEGYVWKYKNQQVSQFGIDFSTPPASVFYTTNIGSSTIKGVDVDFEALVTPTTRFSGSVQYLKTSYDTFVFNVSSASPTPPNYNCPAPLVGAFYVVDCSGKPSLFSPLWSFNMSLEQTFRLNGYKLVAQGGTRWRGDYYAATSYQPWVISNAQFQSDASLTLAPDSDAWFVAGFVNNIENKRRFSQANVNSNLFTYSAVAGPPRTYGIRIGAKFR